MKMETLRRETGDGLKLDPRTKLLLMLTISVFVLGSAGGGIMVWVRPVLSVISFALLLCDRRIAAAVLYGAAYSICYAAWWFLLPLVTGMLNFVILTVCSLFCRFLPGFMTGYYLVRSTTVSEFTAGMRRMHISDKIVIPLSVMFRFFPTVAEESRFVQDAMRMRGIRLGSRKSSRILEYRVIPVMTCAVKIGDELSAAALTRGLGAPVRRTNLCEIGFRAQDIAVIAVCLSAALCFLLQQTGQI